MLSELVQHWAAEEEQQQAAGSSGSGAAAAPGGSRRPRAILLYSSRAPEEFALLRRLLDLQAASGGTLQVRLHCSAHTTPPGTADKVSGSGAGTSSGSGGGGSGSGDPAEAEAEAAAAEAAEPGPRRPPPILLRSGVRSLARRRLLPGDLLAAVAELRAGAADSGIGGVSGGGGGGAQVTAYVCGPPALSDEVVALLEADREGVARVVIERWW